MICFHVYGGLGNQMFIYAFSRELKLCKKEEYCLSKLDKLKYFQLSSSDWYFNFVKFLFFKVNEKILRKTQRFFLKDQSKDHYNEVLNLGNNIALDGYFQGERYFQNVKMDVLNLFKIRSKHIASYQKLFPSNDSKTIVVHVRRSDYAHSFQGLGIGEGSFILPLEYYFNALNTINNISLYKLIFISDDINYVKEHFNHFPNAYYSSHSEIIDLQILINANIIIAANSSFSWWGAYLNQNPSKMVYVPMYFLGYKVKREFPLNIIPKEWKQISV